MEAPAKYRKLDPREHVLARPGMYVGSVEHDTCMTWVLDEASGRMVKRNITYVPGFYKCFDELLTNAMDHVVRLAQDPTAQHQVRAIKVTIDRAAGVISVWNDGDGVEVDVHPDTGLHIPELIFGHMLTSSNYDDTQEKVIGGQNGIGAKACNIFSKSFYIETVDAARKKVYSQEFFDNMSRRTAPVIRACSKKPYTLVRFVPDFERFKMAEGITDDVYGLLLKRCYDACALTRADVAVFFNGTKLEIKNFEQYVDLYLGSKAEHARVHEAVNERWEVCASYNESAGFEQVSFVNGIATMRGGKHVEYIANQIAAKLAEVIMKRAKGADVKPAHIRSFLFLFVKATIVNPTFDSQTKETLTSPVSKFGSKAEISDRFIEKLYKSGIVERVLALSELSADREQKKTDGKKRSTVRGIHKLDDANWAGTAKSGQCTLILTEGDSAKTTAIAGLSEVGRDRFGVFPLRGKVMNVKDVGTKKLADNEEIASLKKILGLESGRAYQTLDDLRYGRIMIMTDQDSVTGDTPLLVRDQRSGMVCVCRIDALCEGEDWARATNGKDYGECRFDVWTEAGWTPVVHIIRHKVQKRLFRVQTDAGVVDVTEDHSLLTRAGEKIAPKACVPGTALLHSVPSPKDLVHACDDAVAEMAAYELGRRWSRDNLSGGSAALPLERLLGASRVAKELFFRGCQSYDTDGGDPWVTARGKLAAQQLYILGCALGHRLQLASEISAGSDIYTWVVCQGSLSPLSGEVKSVCDLGATQHVYVYDLETANHHFQAGVGAMIVHNTDGSHIKGLLFNLFDTLWPSLIRQPGFLTSLLTPIIKARRRDVVHSFYSLPDFDRWRQAQPGGAAGWEVKYYKGLGTSTPEEAKEYFRNMRLTTYTWSGESSKDALELAFNKKRSNSRKAWLEVYDASNTLDYAEPRVSIEDFVHRELILYAKSDVERSIPSVVDGLKVSQRKIVYACMRRTWDKDLKVAQLAGYVSETTGYHHGEASLTATINGLAQDFVGTNNMPLLQAIGQFGTRIQGGKDAASARYIRTMPSRLMGLVIKRDDSSVLKCMQDDDGTPVEPEFYVPVLPLVLVNGACGIGTGFSTNVPQYNPLDIVALLREFLQTGDIAKEPTPWYAGFTGTIEPLHAGARADDGAGGSDDGSSLMEEDDAATGVARGRFVSRGVYSRTGATTVRVTELPVGTWTEDFKVLLEKLLEVKGAALKAYDSHYDSDRVDFRLHFTSKETLDEYVAPLEAAGSQPLFRNRLEKELKLASTKQLLTSNMVLFNSKGQVKKYADVRSIIRDYAAVRLEYYALRKQHLLQSLAADIGVLSARVRFIQEIISGDLRVNGVARGEVQAQLQERGYPRDPRDGAYDYLLRMPLYSLTAERKAELERELDALQSVFATTQQTAEPDMWLAELTELERAYQEYLAQRQRSDHAAGGPSSALAASKNKKKRST